MGKSYYKKYSKEEIREAFKRYDLNNSGSISAEELRIVMSKMHRFYTKEQVEDLIKEVDRNKDGLIQIDEFIALIDNEN